MVDHPPQLVFYFAKIDGFVGHFWYAIFSAGEDQSTQFVECSAEHTNFLCALIRQARNGDGRIRLQVSSVSASGLAGRRSRFCSPVARKTSLRASPCFLSAAPEILNARRGLLAEFPVQSEAFHFEPSRTPSSWLAPPPQFHFVQFRRREDSNLRYPKGYTAFRVRPIQPLWHISKQLICQYLPTGEHRKIH